MKCEIYWRIVAQSIGYRCHHLILPHSLTISTVPCCVDVFGYISNLGNYLHFEKRLMLRVLSQYDYGLLL